MGFEIQDLWKNAQTNVQNALNTLASSYGINTSQETVSDESIHTEVEQETQPVMQEVTVDKFSELSSEEQLIRTTLAQEKNIIDGEIRSEKTGDADIFVAESGRGADSDKGGVAWCAAYANYVIEESGMEEAQWYKDISQDVNRDGVNDAWTVKYVKAAAEEASAEA